MLGQSLAFQTAPPKFKTGKDFEVVPTPFPHKQWATIIVTDNHNFALKSFANGRNAIWPTHPFFISDIQTAALNATSTPKFEKPIIDVQSGYDRRRSGYWPKPVVWRKLESRNHNDW